MVTIIGICGGSGSGKTTFVKTLEEKFTKSEVSFLSFDNYYKNREEQVWDEEGVQNFDLPESMEIKEFLQDVEQLKLGKSIQRKEYVFNNELSTPKMIEIEPSKVIVIEGLFIYHYDELRKLIDLKLFIDADDEVKIIRRIRRDQIERNYPLDDVLYRYKNHVIPSYRKFIEPYISEIDLIINNNHNFEKALKVIEAYIRSNI